MDNGPGWFPDPEHEGQERYWDGSDWTDQVRPEGSPGSLHLSDHVPELQRALAAATAGIDEVEDRLSMLFDRTGSGGGAGADEAHETAPPAAADADAAGADGVGAPHEEFEAATRTDDADVDADDDDAFTELDEALAAEAPDKGPRRFFRRKT